MDNEKEKELIVYDEDIRLDLSDLSNLKVYDAPMEPGRKDKGVIINSSGKKLKAGRIMLGKQNVELNNGTYISVKEATEAIKNYLNKKLSENENKVIVSRRSMERVKITDVITAILQKSTGQIGKILITDQSKDGHARLRVKGENEPNYQHKASSMYKKNIIQLPNGEYIESEEMMDALNDYFLGKKKLIQSESEPVPKSEGQKPENIEPGGYVSIVPKPEGPGTGRYAPEEPKSQKENKRYLLKRTKKKYRLLPFILPMLITITMQGCIPRKNNIEYIGHDLPTEATAEITEEVEYFVTQNLTGTEALLENLKKMETGDTIYLDKGTYHESSDYKYGGANKAGTFGRKIRPAGNYEITYVSLINKTTGQIVQVQYNQNDNIGNFIEQTINQNNLQANEIDIMLHIGGPVSGWIDARDIATLTNAQVQVPHTKTVTQQKTQQNYNGTINFTNDEGHYVSIGTSTPEGNLVQNGTKIKGSDGKEYALNRIGTSTKHVVEEKVTNIPGEPDKVNMGLEGNLTENLITSAVVGAGLSIAATELTKEKEKEELTKAEFEEKKKEFKKVSKWAKFKNSISSIIHKENWRLIAKNIKRNTYDNEDKYYDIIKEELLIGEEELSVEKGKGGKR